LDADFLAQRAEFAGNSADGLMLRSRPGVATADCTDVTDEGRHFPDIRAISEIRGFPAVRRELRPLEELPAEGLADANFAIGNGQFALCNRPVKCRAGLRGPGKLQIAN
jgi:hypothetical protein